MPTFHGKARTGRQTRSSGPAKGPGPKAVRHVLGPCSWGPRVQHCRAVSGSDGSRRGHTREEKEGGAESVALNDDPAMMLCVRMVQGNPLDGGATICGVKVGRGMTAAPCSRDGDGAGNGPQDRSLVATTDVICERASGRGSEADPLLSLHRGCSQAHP